MYGQICSWTLYSVLRDYLSVIVSIDTVLVTVDLNYVLIFARVGSLAWLSFTFALLYNFEIMPINFYKIPFGI